MTEPPRDPATLTSPDTYFQDLQPGTRILHARGRMIGDSEHVTFTAQALNTAQIHFNQDLVERDPAMQAQSAGRRLVVGTYVLAVCMGLSSSDTFDNARIERIVRARHLAPVFPYDTVYARTTVLDKADDRTHDGLVRFRLEGLKADRRTVCLDVEYEARVRKRPDDPHVPEDSP